MATATYTPIASITSTGYANYSFTSIPSTYTDLRLIITPGTGAIGGNIQFNGDTGTNYSMRYINGDGSSATSSSSQNAHNTHVYSINVDYNALWIIDIFQYANTGVYKTVLTQVGSDNNGADTPTVQALVSLWQSTSAITSIGNMDINTGGTATLYGIKNA